jgi:hypothetical protein
MKKLLQFRFIYFNGFYAQSTVLLVNGRPLMMKRQSKISCGNLRAFQNYGKIVDIVDAEKSLYCMLWRGKKTNQ